MPRAGLIEKIIKAYRDYGIPFPRYLATRILPVALSLSFLTFWLIPRFFPIIKYLTFAKYALYALPVYATVAVFVHPITQALKKRREIEERMHILVTRLAVMSEAGLPRDIIIRSIVEDPVYGEIAEIFRRVYTLVDKWKISLARALRLVAEDVLSDVLREFMNRFASALEVGEDLKEFFKKEQKVLLVEYETRYRTSLELAGVLREIYVSTLVSVMFLLSFLVIVPIIAGGDPLTFLFMGVLAYAFVEGLIYYFLQAVLPEEKLYGEPREIPYQFDQILTRLYIPTTLLASVMLGVMFYVVVPAGLFLKYWPAFISTSLSPLLIVGILIYKDEKRVRNRDKNYDSFLRVLGAAAIASAEGLVGAVERALSHDFGELNTLISNLYKRLKMRINKVLSWQYFMDESGSWLIQTYTRMFIDSVVAGGDPALISKLVTENVSRTLSLRTERMSLVSNVTGILYGVSIGIAMSMGVLVQMMAMLNKTMSQVSLAGLPIQIPIFTISYDLGITSFLVLSVIAVHAAFGSLIIRDMSGGHRYSSILHLVAMFWISSTVYTIMQNVMSRVLNI